MSVKMSDCEEDWEVFAKNRAGNNNRDRNGSRRHHHQQQHHHHNHRKEEIMHRMHPAVITDTASAGAVNATASKGNDLLFSKRLASPLRKYANNSSDVKPVEQNPERRARASSSSAGMYKSYI